MKKHDLNAVLKECKKSASAGYRIATKQHRELKNTLAEAKEEIKNTLIEFQTSQCYFSGATEMLSDQLTEISNSFDTVSFAFTEDLQNLHEKLSKFSITLFGRTMAGKSTLMEILTHGDGASIGKGAQRTTRDIRTYIWKDLEITDVPGVGAFGGEDDENVAYEAAKRSDLILFLITDDAPQAVEAECFGRLVDLGKPLICLMNVKVAMVEGKNQKLIIRDINKRFDTERLDAIRRQFLQYAQQLGQDWNSVPFVYVHLKAAYLAQQTKDRDLADGLNTVSRIDDLKNMIIEQVREKGAFYREKTFLDSISVPILRSMESLLDQSLLNSQQGRIILSKKRQLNQWKKDFHRDGKKRIESLLINIRSQLNSEIAAFAEEHYDDSKADKAWNRVIRQHDVSGQCQDLLFELEERCNSKIMEVSREITSELNYISAVSADKTLRMNHIIDEKKIWNWAAVLIGGGLSIAAAIAGLFGATAVVAPLGVAAGLVAGVAVVGDIFFSKRSQKEHEARKRLERKLQENVNKVCDKINKDSNDYLDALITKRMDALIMEMSRIDAVVFRLADTQRGLAWKLNDHLLDLNYKTASEAMRFIGVEDSEYSIMSVARIPGTENILCLDNDRTFSEDLTKQMAELMSERISTIDRADKKEIMISRVIGNEADIRSVSIEEKIGVAHIKTENGSPYLKNKIRMAQQLTQIAITDE